MKLASVVVAVLLAQALIAQDAGRERDTHPDHFKELDKNEDGTISPNELPIGAEKFKEIDKDGDGSLSREECVDYLKDLTEEQRRELSGRIRRGFAERLAEKDKNGDKKLSQEEFGASDELFDKIDTNSDGFIDLEELRTHLENLRSRVHDHIRDKRGEGDEETGRDEPDTPKSGREDRRREERKHRDHDGDKGEHPEHKPQRGDGPPRHEERHSSNPGNSSTGSSPS